MKQMKAYYLDPASKGDITFGELKKPRAYGHNVLIKIHATSMNPHDWKYCSSMRKLYKKSIPLPKLTIGHDVSGVVESVGRNVTDFKVGDEVYVMTAKTGAFSEYITTDSRMVSLKPKNISHIEAATIPMVALTSWQAFNYGKIKTGSRVLVIGGSGGVGSSAVQIAKARGAIVTAVCSTRNIEFVKDLGADAVIDYTQEDITKATLDESSKFDIVFDTIGNETLGSCKNIITENGYFLCTLPSNENVSEVFISAVKMFNKSAHQRAVTLLALPYGKHLRQVTQLIEDGEIKPVVDKTYKLEELNESIAYSRQGRTKGKIAIKVC